MLSRTLKTLTLSRLQVLSMVSPKPTITKDLALNSSTKLYKKQQRNIGIHSQTLIRLELFMRSLLKDN